MNTRSTFLLVRIALGLVLLCSLVLGEVSPVSAARRCYVKANASGLNNGTSWVNAYKSLQSALGASPCTEVWVAKGIYKPTGTMDRTKSFILKRGVAIYGGFAGTEAVLSQRNPRANPTILSGNIGSPANSDNSYHVVVGSGTNRTARLDGFTITAGKADGGTGADQLGGGMYNYSGSPSLVNMTFTGNSAVLYGGGMVNDSGSPSLTNVTFSGNSVANYGGGMANAVSSPILTNVTFSGNAASSGGGMFNSQSSPILVNVTLSGNTATVGGGMYNYSGNPLVTNSILYGDTGGEIYNDSSSLTVSYSIVQGGYAGTGNLATDPLLGPLANNGGFTKTMATGFGSPAIDKGTNSSCPSKDQRGIARPQGPRCDIGAYEYLQKRIVLLSAGTQDGWILESTETSAVGGTMNAGQATFALGDDAADRQGRTILSFNTGGVPDNAVLTSATLKVRGAGVVGTNPFTTHGKLLADVRRGAFSGNAGLQLQDFQALASKDAAMIIMNNPVSGWCSGTMGVVNFVYINKIGVTQFRLRFTLDDNDDLNADYLKFYSGDSSTVTYRPKLIVTYYVP